MNICNFYNQKKNNCKMIYGNILQDQEVKWIKMPKNKLKSNWKKLSKKYTL